MPKGNAVIYKPKEVSWEREVTFKKKKHSSWLELRAGFSHRVRDPVQPDQTLALLSEQFWPNFLPAPAGADATSLFHIISAEDLLQCEKLHHQSTQIHPFANIEKISWEQLLSKVAEGWEKKPQILFWLSFPPPILSITFTWCLTHICFWWACENCCPFSWMGNNHYEYGWSDIGTSSGISAHLRGERVKQDWVLRRLTTTANSKSFRKAFDQRRDRKLYSKLVCDL